MRYLIIFFLCLMITSSCKTKIPNRTPNNYSTNHPTWRADQNVLIFDDMSVQQRSREYYFRKKAAPWFLTGVCIGLTFVIIGLSR